MNGITDFLTSVSEQVQEVSRAAYAAVVGDNTREKRRAELKKVLNPILEDFKENATDEIKEEALNYCMETFMGPIAEAERDRAALEATLQQHNTEIRTINGELARQTIKMRNVDGQLADAKKKHGLTHELVRNLHDQVDLLKLEVEQLKNDRKEKVKKITEDAKKLSNEHFDVDVVSGLIIPKSSGGAGNNQWGAFGRNAFDVCFERQMNAVNSNQMIKMIGKQMDLEGYCKSKGLLPVVVDAVMPQDHYEFDKMLTSIQNKLYSTVKITRDEGETEKPGPALVLAQLTMNGLRDHLKSATVVKKDPKDKENLLKKYTKALTDSETSLVTQITAKKSYGAINTLVQQIGNWKQKMEESSGRMRSMWSRRIDEALTKLKMLQFIEEQKSSQSSFQSAEIDRLAGKLFHPTEQRFQKLRIEANQATCPQLPSSCIGVNYTFKEWVDPDVTAKLTYHVPEIDVHGCLHSRFAEDMFKVEQSVKNEMAEMKQNITTLEESQEEYKRDLATFKQEAKDETNEAEKLAKEQKVEEQEKIISNKEEEINDLKVSVEALELKQKYIETQKQEDAEESSKLLALARSRARNVAGMKAAAHKHKVDFKKFLDEQKMIKPVFEAVGDKPPVDGCFTDYFFTQTISKNSGNTYFSSQSQTSTPQPQTNNAENEQNNEGENTDENNEGENNDENEQNNEESRAVDNERLESEKFCISFQSMFAELQNDCWSLIEDSLADPNWYIDGMRPGRFWTQDGYGARFVPAEALFVQKFAFYSTNSVVTRDFEKNATSGDGGETEKCTHGMSATKDGKTVIAPNLNLKLVLVKPIWPAPMRGGHNAERKKDKISHVMKQDYAEHYLGRITWADNYKVLY